MRSFATRRRFNLGMFVMLTLFVLALHKVLSIGMYPTAFMSGWTLAGFVLVLTTYNVRKKLSFLPLGSTATWLQLHIYGALLSLVLFAVHVEFRIPNGVFESGLAVLYLLVFLSGVIGLVLSRAIPPRLTTRGEDVLFERIPIFMKRIRDEVEEAVLGSVAETETTAISEIHMARLKRFFDRPRRFWQQLLQSNVKELGIVRKQEKSQGKNEREVSLVVVDGFLSQIRDEVKESVFASTLDVETTAISNFYTTRLKRFFDSPRHFWQHLLQSGRPRNRLLAEVRAHERFLNKNEQDIVQKIIDLICAKDDLDHQHALQWTLRAWLFVHIPFTYALLVFSLFHVVLVHTFAGGTR